MALSLPRIPVAARSLAVLEKRGVCKPIPHRDKTEAIVQLTKDKVDPVIVWASPTLKEYKSVWEAAHGMGVVEAIDTWGKGIDVDHVYPKSWATMKGMEMAYVRLFPAWSEINRSAGAGREKARLQELKAKPQKVDDVMFAEELQVLKIIGHPVGTTSDPERLFGTRKPR
jgi:hypothetical protein